MTTLFDDATMGTALHVKNRIFMAPLTRNRAYSDGRPWEKAATYYAQRAGAGLIISEATQISAEGKGYINTPGIYTPEQVKGWRDITDAVHIAGGKIFCQLWHVGRISHTSLQEEGKAPVAPSAIKADGQTFTEDGMVDVSEPRALGLDEIPRLIEDYKHAAQCAKDAGFDGVEIHAANGYLLNQFLEDTSNQRDDAYGGSIPNRARLLFEIIEAVASVWSRSLIGVRLSPTGTFNDMGDSNPQALYDHVISKLSNEGLAYMHMVEKFPGIDVSKEETELNQSLRKLWDGFYITNGDYDFDSGSQVLASGYADAVAYGRPYIANPDLAERFAKGAELNEPDDDTFYGGDEKGYIDYPTMDEKAAA